MDNEVVNPDEIEEFTKLIADDLESGELEKVTSLLRYNKTLYAVVGGLVKDERMKVRLGINMSIEELQHEKPEDVGIAVSSLLPLLKDESAMIRGDAADLLGMVGGLDEIGELKYLLTDPHHQVVEIAEEAIENIQSKNPI